MVVGEGSDGGGSEPRPLRRRSSQRAAASPRWWTNKPHRHVLNRYTTKTKSKISCNQPAGFHVCATGGLVTTAKTI